MQSFGKSPEFQFDLDLSEDQNDRTQAWGKGILWVGNDAIWANDDSTPIEWSWLDLLEFLGSSWLRLNVEEAYPFQPGQTDPIGWRQAAEEFVRGLVRAIRNEKELELRRFECSHDLARGMRGISLPSVFLMREGSTIWVCSEQRRLRLRFEDVINTLKDCGDFIAKHVGQSLDPTSRVFKVLKQWQDRERVERATVLRYRLDSKRTASELSSLLAKASKNEVSVWEDNPDSPFDDTELMAAARMTADSLQPEVQAKIILEVKAQHALSTVELDALSREAEQVVDPSCEPYAQGYELARWLRNKLAIDGKADPELLLAAWKVPIVDINNWPRTIDALACWGPRHGPAILVNQDGRHAQSERGRRSTLAHELAHLLIDRRTSLPLVEVQGGNVPAFPEKRARAFAAEFLLPQDTLRQRLEHGGKDVLKELQAEFWVSQQIVAWQAINGNVGQLLDSAQRELIERWRDVS